MSAPAWTRIVRTRPGIAATTVVAFVSIGTYAAVSGFSNPDTKSPVVRVDAVSSTVEGTEALSAVCKDNVGCTGVTFNLDGTPIDAVDDSAPYGIDWDTTSATDGAHELTAYATDAAGNSATSSGRHPHVENGRANEWVNTTAGASPSRCSTPCAYNSSHAYGSFNAAAAAASANDLVLVRDGTYPAQAISDSPSGTDAITIKSNNGLAKVTTGSLSVSTSYVTLDGFTTGAGDHSGYGIASIGASDNTGGNPRTETHVTFKNIVTHGLFIATDNVTVQNVVVGPTHACDAVAAGLQEDGVLIATQVAAQGSAHDISFDNLTVHDVDRWQDGIQSHGTCENHTDGMQFFSGDGVTIENSHFYRNATSNILARPCCDGSPKLDNWTLENNEFGATLEGGNGVLIGASAEGCNVSTGFLIQNNVFSGESLRLGCTGTPAVVRSNIFAIPSFDNCAGGDRNGTYSYNVFGSGADSSCTGSSHAKTCDPTWADPTHASGNYDTAASDTCARDAADPVHFPALDIHGVSRPIGSAPDAGANEAG